MDLQSLTAAQRRSENQLRFDPEAFDRAMLRADRRRAALHRFGAKIAGQAAWLAAQWRAWPVLHRRAAPGADGR